MSDPAAFREPRAASLRLLLIGVLALALLWIFASRFILIELNLRRLGAPLLVALAQALSILAAGRGAILAMERFGPDATPRPARLRVDFLAGYPLFGTLCFLIGLVSTSPIVMGTILVAGIVGGAAALRSYERVRDGVLPMTGQTVTAGAILIIAIATGALTAQLPAISLDEVAYHLAVPRMWVAEGRVVDLPLLSHSYFPFGIEAADLPALSLLGADGAIASHFVHLLAALATIFLMHQWLLKRTSAEFALVITAIVATTPALLITAGWSWNEWPLVGICVALLAALDEERPHGATIAVLVAAGLLTKYSFPLFALALLAARRDRALFKPILIGAVLGSVFFIRNLVLTGNPVAPFLSDLAPNVSGFRADLAGYIFDGAFLDEALGIGILVLSFGALITLSRDRFHRDATIALVLATILVWLGMPSSRLLLPFLVPLALLGGIALPPGRIGWIGVVIAALQLFLTSVYVSRLTPFDVLAGRVSDEQHVATQRAPLASVFWMDAQLPANSRTLVLGVHELFWFSHRVRGGGNFDANRLAGYLRGDVGGNLRRDGITHVAIAGDGLKVGSDPQSKREEERVTVLDANAAINLREFLQKNGRLVASQGNTAIYQVR